MPGRQAGEHLGDLGRGLLWPAHYFRALGGSPRLSGVANFGRPLPTIICILAFGLRLFGQNGSRGTSPGHGSKFSLCGHVSTSGTSALRISDAAASLVLFPGTLPTTTPVALTHEVVSNQAALSICALARARAICRARLVHSSLIQGYSVDCTYTSTWTPDSPVNRCATRSICVLDKCREPNVSRSLTRNSASSLFASAAASSAAAARAFSSAICLSYPLTNALADSALASASARCASAFLDLSSAADAFTFSKATSRSAMTCRRLENKKIPPSAKISPATPIITSISNTFSRRFHVGDSEYSPINPMVSNVPNTNRDHSEMSSAVDVVDLDNSRIPIPTNDPAATLGILMPMIAVLILLIKQCVSSWNGWVAGVKPVENQSSPLPGPGLPRFSTRLCNLRGLQPKGTPPA